MKKALLILLFLISYSPTNLKAQYCTTGLYSSACSSGDYIDDVVFGSINNTGSGCNGNPDNYIYYSSMSTNVTPGNSYNITLKSGPSWSEHFGVWIDFNQDGDFNDPGEFVFNTTGSKPSAGTPVNGTVAIPSTALPGITRMRVRCTYSSSGFGAGDACASQTWGECEDYNVIISAPSPTDVGVSNILTPVTNCGLSNAEDVTVVITNYGTTAQSNFTVKYQINGNTPVSEVISATIAPSATYTYVFTTKANLSTPGNYTIKAWTELAGDGSPFNDTTTVQIISIPTISTFPYVEDFTTTGNWVVETASSSVSSSWQHGVPLFKNNITPISAGNACWITKISGSYNSNDDSWIKSPCFDLSALSNPVFKLDIWWESENNWDGTVVQYSTDGGATWQRLGNFNDPINWYNDDNIIADPGGQSQGWTGTTNNNGSGGWVTAQHDITGVPGSAIFRIAFASDGSVQYDGVAVDNIVIAERPAVDLGPDRFMCSGDTIYLTPAGGPFTSYSWSDGSTNDTLMVLYPGTYWVRVKDVNGLVAVDTVKISGASVVANIPKDTISICPDSSYLIIPTIAPTNNVSVVWNTGATSPILSVSQPGKYIITVTDTTGCSATDSTVVQYAPIPNVNIPQDSVEFCAGTSVTLSPVYDNTVRDIWWNNGVTTPIQVTTSPGTYVVYAKNLLGCVAKDTVEVIMNYPPNVDLGPDVFVCDNSPITLSPGLNGNYSYTWSDNSSTPSITVNSNGTYWVRVVDNNTGCENSDTINVAYGQSLTVNLGDSISSCGSITLTAPNYAGVNYVWSTGETSQSIVVNSTGLYSVYLFNPYGCNGSDSVFVEVKDALAAHITSSLVNDTAEVGQQVQFIDATVPVPTSWLWDFGDGNTSTQQNPTHTYQNQGTYIVTLITQRPGYCSDTATKTIVVITPTSVEYLLFGNSLSVYPIPTVDFLTIKGVANSLIKNVKIELKDIQGRTVLSNVQEINDKDVNIKLNLNNISKGTYILIANFDGQKVYRRIVKY